MGDPGVGEPFCGGTGGTFGEPGTTDLLFLRKRFESILELVLRGDPWSDVPPFIAGLFGVVGRDCDCCCCRGSLAKLVGSEKRLLANWTWSIVWGLFIGSR